MYLKRMKLKDFKAFRGEVVLEMAPITVLVGPNSRGKSSIIQALAMLGTQDYGAVDPRGPSANLGAFDEIHSKHSESSSFKLQFDFAGHRVADIGYSIVYPLNNTDIQMLVDEAGLDPVSFAIRFEFRKDSVSSRGLLFPKPEILLPRRLGDIDSAELLNYLSCSYDSSEFDYNEDHYRLLAIVEEVFGIEKRYDWWEERYESDQLFFDDFMLPSDGLGYVHLTDDDSSRSRAIERAELALTAIQANRRIILNTTCLRVPRIPPKRYYANSELSDQASKRNGLSLLGPLAFNKSTYDLHYMYKVPGFEIQPRHEQHALWDGVTYWCKELGVCEDISLQAHEDREYFQIVLKNSQTGHLDNIADVGYGISQLLPVVVATNLGGGRIVMIEEPESHIHPSLQRELPRLFSQSMRRPLIPDEISPEQITRTGSVRVSSELMSPLLSRYSAPLYVIETHSEHFLRGLQLEVAKGRLSPEHLAIYYVDNSIDDPIQRIPIGDTGELQREWPNDFYGVAFSMAMEMRKLSKN